MSELYEEDLSLFSGDILSSFPLFEDINIYDDLKTDTKATGTEAFNPSNDDIVIDTLVSDLGPLESLQDDVTAWMENKINFLDLLITDGAIGGDSFAASAFDVPGDLPDMITDTSPRQNSTSVYHETNLESITDVSSLQSQLDSFSNTSTGLVQLQEDVIDDQIHQEETLHGKDLSISPICDNGIDFSIDETEQSLLELLPRQLIENLDDPSSLSLLLSNAEDGVTNDLDSAMSIFSEDTDKKDISDSGHLGVTLAPMSLGSSSEESSVSSSNFSVDFSYISSSLVPSSPSSVSSILSGRTSPNVLGSTEDTSFRSFKSASGCEKIKDKKLRKMRQNKDAATRYRVKKKLENDAVQNECDTLMTRNAELKDQVETMTREIAYLKELMADVYQAKQAVKASKHK